MAQAGASLRHAVRPDRILIAAMDTSVQTHFTERNMPTGGMRPRSISGQSVPGIHWVVRLDGGGAILLPILYGSGVYMGMKRPVPLPVSVLQCTHTSSLCLQCGHCLPPPYKYPTVVSSCPSPIERLQEFKACTQTTQRTTYTGDARTWESDQPRRPWGIWSKRISPAHAHCRLRRRRWRASYQYVHSSAVVP